ncbi:uncharacterized membrane protein (UPF0136 family) [Paenibacillus sp. PastF-3]|nr:uncharacterized membrane protein (UPF0136 family) [Paenibacillus sp. PastF-3]
MSHGLRKKPDSEEGDVAVVFVLIIFGVALFLPRKIRKSGLIIVSSITVLLLLSFAIRPYWIDYQVSRKTEQLNH